MPGNPTQALEAVAADPHPEVAAFTGSRVTCVQMAVIPHDQFHGLQGSPQRLLDHPGVNPQGGRALHGHREFPASSPDASGLKAMDAELMQ